MDLEYVRFHVICRVNQAEYGIRIPMAAPQKYVNTYSTRRLPTRWMRIHIRNTRAMRISVNGSECAFVARVEIFV